MTETTSQEEQAELLGDSMSNELSANRTSMSFERTSMSAHRTLQAVMKTSLSLIGFGFTIFQFFTALNREYMGDVFPQEAAKNFGLAMLCLGVLILILGIFDHYQTMQALRARKHRLRELGLVHTDMPTRIASSMVIALALLLLGVLAVAQILFGIGLA